MERTHSDTTGTGWPVSLDGPAALPALRAAFPHFRIWHEVTGGRSRYVARRLAAGPGPHTVVTQDLAELRAVLGDGPAQPQPPSSQIS
ncbi:MAG TPA: hypothetical protein VN840_16905 [Streptosporangiaceae bacterium]|nr:hypothetical protein [Streptosporangiaceae bacterium]